MARKFNAIPFISFIPFILFIHNGIAGPREVGGRNEAGPFLPFGSL